MERPKPSSKALENLKRTKRQAGSSDLFIQNKEIRKIVIRLLPPDPDNDKDQLALCVGTHYLPILDERGRKLSFTCPEFTFGQSCAVCSVVNDLYRLEPFKKIGQDSRASKQYWFKVLMRDKDDPYNPDNVKIFKSPKTVFDTVYDEMEEEKFDISHIKAGADIRVTGKGEGQHGREYKAAIQEASKLAPTSADRNAIMDRARQIDMLRFVRMPENVDLLAQQLIDSLDPDAVTDESELERLNEIRESVGLDPVGEKKKKKKKDKDKKGKKGKGKKGKKSK